MTYGTRMAQFWVIFIGATAAWAQAPDTLELRYEELPKLLAERNQSVQSAGLFEEAASARTGYFARSFLPRLTIEGGAENFQTGTLRRLTQPFGLIEARVNLLQGGKDYFENQVREGELLSARSHAKRIQSQELREMRQAYWELLFQQEAVDIFKKAEEQNDRYLGAANRRIQRGLTTETDRVDFEINRDILKEEVESLEHEIILTEVKLRGLLSSPDSQRFRGVGKIGHDHDESLLNIELEASEHPEALELEASERVSSARSSAKNLWWLPSVDAYAGYYLFTQREREYVDQSLRSDTVLGVRLTLHLFDGFESIREASSASKQAEAQEGRTLQELKKVRARFKLVQEEMKHLHELIHSAEKRIELGQNYLNRTLSDYDRGVKNSVDMLGALQRQIQFQRRYAELRRDYQVSKAELLGMLGK